MASSNNFNADVVADLRAWALQIVGPTIDTSKLSWNDKVVYYLKQIVEGS